MDSILSSLSPFVRARMRPLGLLLRSDAMQRSRHRLGELDDHLLRDIGLTRGEASLESRRAGWDAPRHWLRQGPL